MYKSMFELLSNEKYEKEIQTNNMEYISDSYCLSLTRFSLNIDCSTHFWTGH